MQLLVARSKVVAAEHGIPRAGNIDPEPMENAQRTSRTPVRGIPGRIVRPPRPLGVATGTAWEPRDPERVVAKQSFDVWGVEFLEKYPLIQPLVAAALRVAAAHRKGGPADAPTPPPDVANEAGSWMFAAVGDYGTGSAQQARVAANILRARPQLVVTVGDNVYPTGRWEDYARNWDPPHLYGTLAREIPFMPTVGNHDMYHDDMRPYFGHFPHLNGQPYYTYAMKNAQFFALDSDQDLRVGSAQYRWLEAQLAGTRQRWKIVYLHYPLYGRDPRAFDEIRRALQPLFVRYGVQLVLAGHEHNYQRSHAIQGVTHILTGGGGQQVWPFMSSAGPHTARRAAAYHHVEVSVGPSRMVVRAIDENGRRIDTAVIPAGRGAAAAPSAQHTTVTPRRRGRPQRAAGAAHH